MVGPLANILFNYAFLYFDLGSYVSQLLCEDAPPARAPKLLRSHQESCQISIAWSSSVPKDLQYEITSIFCRACVFIRLHALEKIGQS